MDEGDEVCEFGLEDGVEVCGGAQGDEAVGVCEGGEDADSAGLLVEIRCARGAHLLVAVLKHGSNCHDCDCFVDLLECG